MKYSVKKYLCKLLLFPSILGTISSCVTDDMPAINDVAQCDVPINIGASITQQYVTRVNDNGFADGDSIGVFIVNYENGKPQELSLTGNHADNVMFTYNDADGKWVGAYQLYWKDSKTPVDAYGYYPFNAELPSVTAYPFEVQRNQNALVEKSNLTGYEFSDFLWAKTENIMPTNNQLTLNHRHLMAGVQVTLVKGYGFGDGEWENLTKQITIDNTRLKTNISLQTGDVYVDESSNVQAIIPLNSGKDYRAIVAPQIVKSGKVLISVNIDGIPYEYKREEDIVYHSGKLHRFTLQVSKALPEGDYRINLLEESVLPWQNDLVSHNGAAREYITVHVEEGEYIGDVINQMGLDPQEIINMKLTGTLADYDHFSYIRENMPNLEAINMKELRTKNQQSFYWEGDGTAGDGWGEPPYNQPIFADDYIPIDAFQRMRYLSYVVWPDHLVGIGDGAFVGCNLRGSLIFPEGLKHIGGGVFEGWNTPNSALTGELYLPSTLEYVGGGAFDPADNLKCNLTGDFILPSNIKYIGAGAFGACHYLTGQVHIPESMDRLEKGALPENLTGDVVIPSRIKFVGGVSKKISSIRFSEGVEEIGNEAFWDVKTLRGDLSFPSTVKRIGEVAFAGTNISHVKLPESIDVIERDAFSWCKYLQDTLTIPASVERIKSRAFAECDKLSAIILPENILFIEDEAFANCRSLEYIECRAIDPPSLSGSAFNGVEKNNFTLVVPEESVEAYKNANGWREFKRIAAYRNFVCRPMDAGLLNKGDTRSIVLNADGNWIVSQTPSWARPSINEGYKKTEFTVEIEDLPHGAGNRSGSIVFTLQGKVDEDGNPITCSYNITQYDYEYDEDTELILQQATKGNNGGINITFVGDGYSAKDIYEGTYITNVQEGVEYLFGLEPYKSYRSYFNVNVAFALSYDSGVCSNVNIWRDTKFDTTYGAGDNGRLLVHSDAVFDYLMNDIEEASITEDNVNQSLVVCILHSDVYEGVTALYSTGAAVAFIPHCRNEYPNDYRGLMQHEAGGHGFGKLADEYIYHRAYIQTCLCTCCGHVDDILTWKALGWYRNISLSGKYSDIEWSHLIFHPNYDDIVDIYDGAYMHERGVYRSEVNSCMNDNIPYYSTISRQAIVERIKEYAREPFSFDDFVANDSREYGEITRSSHKSVVPSAVHNQSPIIINGSPLDYIKIKR